MRIFTRLTFCTLFLVFTVNILSVQAQDEPPRPGMARLSFQLSSFANTSGYPPESIITMDNNLHILVTCAGGATVEELQAKNVNFIASQLRLLIDWNLIVQVDNKFYTTFPILYKDKIEYLRNLLESSAEIIGKYIAEDVNNLKSAFIEREKPGYEYTTMFSYILDELVWKEFEKRNIRVKTELTAAQPFWTGVLWALETPREFMMGTTSVVKEGVTFRFNWNQTLGNSVNQMLINLNEFNILLSEYAEKGKVESPGVVSKFNQYNILDPSGNFVVPVIEEIGVDKVFNYSTQIAEKISARFLQIIDFEHLQKELGTMNTLQAFAISYQEFMFELMEYCVREGLVTMPGIFRDPGTASERDLGSLVLIIKSVDAGTEKDR
ncbi:hypothetical protein ACFL6G_00310 [candidate division KSB1 bacterium]